MMTNMQKKTARHGKSTKEVPKTTKKAIDPPPVTAEDEFIPIGAREKVQWKLILTAVTTDDKINAKGPGRLTNALIQVEKIFRRKFRTWLVHWRPKSLQGRYKIFSSKQWTGQKKRLC